MTLPYDPNKVTVTVDGRVIVGLAEGDAIMVAPNTDSGQIMVGMQGSAVFSRSADRSATITLRLQHNSASHRFLVAKHKARSDRSFAIVIRDTVSGEGGVGAACWFLDQPDQTFGAAATTREWRFAAEAWVPSVPEAV